MRAVLPYAPDIIALQEVRNPQAYKTALGETNLVYSDALEMAGGPGLFVGSRWPLTRLPAAEWSIPPDEHLFFRNPPLDREVRIRMLSLSVIRETQPFELHVVHVPPGSTNGWRKIDTFRAAFNRLTTGSNPPRILCGDFNEPRSETADGLITWAGRNKFSKVAPEKWDTSVKEVLTGLAGSDLRDVFRVLHGASTADMWSVCVGRNNRRYDHVFASERLRVTRAEYLPYDATLSDHRPALVEFAE